MRATRGHGCLRGGGHGLGCEASGHGGSVHPAAWCRVALRPTHCGRAGFQTADCSALGTDVFRRDCLVNAADGGGEPRARASAIGSGLTAAAPGSARLGHSLGAEPGDGAARAVAPRMKLLEAALLPCPSSGGPPSP